MQQTQLLLAQATERNPLVIAAEVPLAEAISLMNQVWKNWCARPPEPLATQQLLTQQPPAQQLFAQQPVNLRAVDLQGLQPNDGNPNNYTDHHYDHLENFTLAHGYDQYSHEQHSHEQHSHEQRSHEPYSPSTAIQSSGCAIVLNGSRLKGIFTEQDLVRLLTSGKSLEGLTLGDVVKSPVVCLQTAADQNIFSALQLFEQHGVQHLPVVDEQQHLLGLVTPQSIENALEPTDLQSGCRVESVMTNRVTRVPASASVLEVAQRMTDEQSSCVLLTEPFAANEPFDILAQRPVGIMTERDILQLYHLGPDLAQVSANAVMSTPVFCVAPHDSVWLAHRRMKHHRIRHLVVTNAEGVLQGLMTQTQLMQAISPLEMRQVFRSLRRQHSEVLPLQFLQNRTTALVQDVQTYAETIKSQVDEADMFSAIAGRIQQFLSLPDILGSAVTEVREFLQTDRVLVYRFDPDMSGTVIAESVGEGWPSRLNVHIQDAYFQLEGCQAYRQGRKRAIDDIQAADLSDCHIRFLSQIQVKANLTVPILFDDQLWGLLIAHQCSQTRHWKASEIEVLDRLAVQMAIAIRQAEISIEKKQLEEKFLRIQRLESLGTLASGIAHDLNNILTPIIGIAQLLPSKLDNIDPSTQQLIDILYRSAKRGSDIVNQILSFARGQEGKRGILLLKHSLQEIHELVQNTFPRSIQVETLISPDLWMIEGNATRIHQVLINLCVNARDAMPEGGKLTLNASNLRIDESYVQVSADAHIGAYVNITVTDTGVGMNSETLAQIFTPFFTTKEIEGGTGLGLPTVLGIVKEHGGFVTVSSQVGKGTTFQVFFPAVKTATALPPIDPALPTGEGQLILVVDDEPGVRAITQVALETYGYRVLTAQDGIEAIALFAQYSETISVVIMDMMMPIMGGETAIRTLQRMEPGVRLIAMSGLSFAQTPKDFVAKHKVDAILAKPYTTTKLLETLQQVLQG